MIPDYPGGLKVTTKVLIREREAVRVRSCEDRTEAMVREKGWGERFEEETLFILMMKEGVTNQAI